MNGIIVVNKPVGYTSRDVVNIISKKFNTKKVGHTGTLDPIATGVLVICLNKATKIVELITNEDKEYIATFKLGIETDTLDITGNIINECNVINFSKDEIIEVLNNFIGNIKQQVPKYSAVKVNGRKMYEYARSNIDFDPPFRDVEIKSIELLDISDEIKIKVSVSKGTYIRSLIRDIGYKLNTYATMTSLVRTKQGNISIDESYTLEEINQDKYKIIPIDILLEKYESKVVDVDLEFKIRNGEVLDKFFYSDICVIKNNKGELLSIYKTYQKDINKVKPYKMF